MDGVVRVAVETNPIVATGDLFATMTRATQEHENYQNGKLSQTLS
jgi:hypothetical protein